MILIALVLGALSIYLFKILLDAEKEKAKIAQPAAQEKVELQKVLVTKDDIPMGKAVGSLDVDIVDYPVRLVPPGALTNTDQLSGKLTAALIPKGDVISDKKVVLPSQLPRASMIVEHGRRLLSIRVDEIKANGFLVKNGDFVDLMGTFGIPDGLAKGGDVNSRTLTVTFLQRVKVFDIIYGNDVGNSGQGDKPGQRADGGGDRRLARGTTATFDVTTKEAELIMSADGQAQGGGLMLVLRRPDDEVIDPPPSELHKQLIGALQGENTRKKVEEPLPVAPVAPARKKIL